MLTKYPHVENGVEKIPFGSAPGCYSDPVWQKRFYDFNVWSETKRIEKLRYVHRNPGSPASPLL